LPTGSMESWSIEKKIDCPFMIRLAFDPDSKITLLPRIVKKLDLRAGSALKRLLKVGFIFFIIIEKGKFQGKRSE